MKKYKAAVVSVNPDGIKKVYTEKQISQIAEITDLYPGIGTVENVENGDLKDVEVLFSTWGMLRLNAEQLEKMPKLQAVFYAAGAVDYFAEPFFDKNIKVLSAWTANAIPVAEFCLAQIILALKGYFQSTRRFNCPENRKRDLIGPGAYGETVALIGSGAVSTYLQKLLKNLHLNVIVVPSFAENREELIEKVFATAQVVSNHLPNRDDDEGVLNGKHFASMRPGAVFINTGRGRQVKEAEMIEVLEKRPDLTALLDVTYPEPPEEDSKLYKLDNVFLSPHLAGSLNDETHRMVDFMIEEYLRFANGEKLQFEVDPSMLLSAKRPK